MGNGVRVCRVFGQSPVVFLVMSGEKEAESFDDLQEAATAAGDFIKTMSALKGRSRR